MKYHIFTLDQNLTSMSKLNSLWQQGARNLIAYSMKIMHCGIFVSVFTKKSWWCTNAWISTPCCDITFNFKHIFSKNYIPLEIYEGKFLSHCSSGYHVMESVGMMNIHTSLPDCIHV
jgi:hypothetical protein